MRKLKLLFAGFALLGGLSANAQTNIIGGWDGGESTASPSTFGWSSSAGRTFNTRNAGSGIRMKTDYSDYKLEDGTEYSYSESSDPSSVLFWVRYNTAGESFTYTFQGLEPDTYYDFSALLAWHNNSNAPTFTVVLTDGTDEMATLTKSISAKTTLYSISKTFRTPSTMTNTTDVRIVFTCNQVGDCMEAISALKLVVNPEPDVLEIAKNDALAALPETAGDGFFTMSQTTIDDFTQRINDAAYPGDVDNILDEINAWAAPATIGSWNIKNVNAGYYLGTNEGNVVLSELPVAITFEKTTNGFYIKAGEKYINMKGGNTWSMSATDVANTAWTFTAADGKYTITGPNGLIGTDDTAAGSYCYGNKAAGNNGTWTISTAVSEEEIAITVAKNALQAAINAHPVPTANIGSGVFQYNSDAVNDLSEKITAAQAVLDNASATKDQVDAQTDIITGLSELVLNAPDAEKIYNIVVSTTGHAKEGNPVIIIPGETSANNPTGYAMNANFESNANLAQAFTFTKVAGNTYKISTILAGENVYLTNGTLNGSAAGWKDSQIQATTNAENAMAFNIAASEKAGSFNIYNSATNTTIACQGGGNIYTEDGNADFTLVETAKPSITINTTAAGWGTVMLPFAVASLPTGVKAYTCDKIEGITLTLVEVDALEANKPYIIEGAWNDVVSGDAQGKALTATEGLLTGTYTTIAATDGQYVLQKQGGKVAFYQVDTSKATPNVPANRAYLEVPSTARALYFDAATAIKTIEALTSGEAEIYGANGARQNGLKKGVNIIKRGDKTMKVMVK